VSFKPTTPAQAREVAKLAFLDRAVPDLAIAALQNVIDCERLLSDDINAFDAEELAKTVAREMFDMGLPPA
jgi:hypothetical protein